MTSTSPDLQRMRFRAAGDQSDPPVRKCPQRRASGRAEFMPGGSEQARLPMPADSAQRRNRPLMWIFSSWLHVRRGRPGVFCNRHRAAGCHGVSRAWKSLFCDSPLFAMLFLLQLILLVCFIVTLARVIFDLVHGSFLIITGLLLLVFGYTLKFVAQLLRLGRRIRLGRRHQIARRFRFARF